MNNRVQSIYIDEDEFIEPYRPYIDAPQATQIFIGTAGSGKSIFLYKRTIAFCLVKKYFRLIITRKVKDTIRDSIFLGLKDIINEWGIADRFRILEHEMDIYCKQNGNMILSFGGDDPAKLKSIKDPSHVLYEEFAESEYSDYAELQRRLRTIKVKQTQFWAALNPEAKFWGRHYFFAESERDEIPLGEVPAKTTDTLILKTSYLQNPYIDHVAYHQKNVELSYEDENALIVYDKGNWGTIRTGAEFYPQFKETIHVGKFPFVEGLRPVVHLTYDFNVVPYMTLLCIQWIEEAEVIRIRVFAEYCLKNPFNSATAVTQAFIDDYEKHFNTVFYYGDASGNRRIAGKGEETNYDDVRQVLQWYVDDGSDRTSSYNKPVLKRRKLVNKALSGNLFMGSKRIVIEIDESCKETRDDFKYVKLGKDGKLKEELKDKKTGIKYESRTHNTDAFEYCFCQLFEDLM